MQVIIASTQIKLAELYHLKMEAEMKVIEILNHEHVLIKEFLTLLSKANDKITSENLPSKEFFVKAFDFSRNFADKFHHYKEEYLMFGLLAQKGNGVIDAEIERHRSQHEHCRNLINDMTKSIDGYAQKLDSPARTLHRNLSEYIQTLRSHIRSEDEVFFPMVEQELSEKEHQDLLNGFEKYEEKSGKNAFAKNQTLVEELAMMIK